MLRKVLYSFLSFVLLWLSPVDFNHVSKCVRFHSSSSSVSPASDAAAGGVAILIRDGPQSPV